MRRGPKREKCSANVIGNAVHVMSLAIGASISDTLWAMTDLVEMMRSRCRSPGSTDRVRSRRHKILN
jgi:hypothetical protein